MMNIVMLMTMMMIMKMTMMMIIVMLMIINIDITITVFIIDRLIFSEQSASCPILQTSHFDQVSARVCLFCNNNIDNNNNIDISTFSQQ